MAVREVKGAFDLLSLHRHNPSRYPHLLESAARGEPLGRLRVARVERVEVEPVRAAAEAADGLERIFHVNVVHGIIATRLTDPRIIAHIGCFGVVTNRQFTAVNNVIVVINCERRHFSNFWF